MYYGYNEVHMYSTRCYEGCLLRRGAAVKCPYCGKENTRVIDSRPTDDCSIRRRRQCDECGNRFTTYEKIETLPLIVVKKDNNREPYDRDSIWEKEKFRQQQ